MDGMNNLKHDSFTSQTKQYGYLTGIVSGIFLLILGFTLEGVLGEMSLSLPKWPYSIALMIACAALFVGLGFVKSEFSRWLGSKTVVFPAVLFFSLFMVVIAIVPQNIEANDFVYFLGLNHVSTNRAFLLICLYLALSMGAVLVSGTLNRKWGEMLASFGMLGVVIVLVIGQADAYRLKMMIGKEHVVFDGTNHDGNIYRIPFAVKLVSIDSDEQMPELRVRNTVSGEVHLLSLKEGQIQNLRTAKNMKIDIRTYYPKTVWNGDEYVESDSISAVPAAFLSIADSSEQILTSGWVSLWGQDQGQFLVIDNEWIAEMVVVFNNSFQSTISVFDSETEFNEVVIGMSQSYRHKGWTIKQTGIDERFGIQSPVVETELSFDRWEELVYILIGILTAGIFLLMLPVIKK